MHVDVYTFVCIMYGFLFRLYIAIHMYIHLCACINSYFTYSYAHVHTSVCIMYRFLFRLYVAMHMYIRTSVCIMCRYIIQEGLKS